MNFTLIDRRISYYKPRNPFSFSTHPYDLGTIMGLWNSYDDNHFLLKIYKMDREEFSIYYTYHLNYALENMLPKRISFAILGRLFKPGSDIMRHKILFQGMMQFIGKALKNLNYSKTT